MRWDITGYLLGLFIGLLMTFFFGSYLGKNAGREIGKAYVEGYREGWRQGFHDMEDIWTGQFYGHMERAHGLNRCPGPRKQVLASLPTERNTCP